MVPSCLIVHASVGKFLNAEESPDPYEIDLNSHNAVDVDADFAWEVAAKSALHEEKKDKDEAAKAKKREKKAKKAEKNASSTLPTVAPAVADADVTPEGEQNAPFELHGVKMTVPKGSFVAMVGRIGTGKSSVLQVRLALDVNAVTTS
jgi:ATP-binding cassette subfamily C (CFTR/MRP) protein 1